MKTIVLTVLVASAACAPDGKHVTKRPATAQLAATQRELAFSRALATIQRRGWIVAVSDRAGGLITTQQMATGERPCGTISCDSRSTLQVTVTDAGEVMVNIHRELFVAYTGRWFVPTLEQDVLPIEAEQRELLAEIAAQ